MIRRISQIISAIAALSALIALALIAASVLKLRANPLEFREGLTLYRYGVEFAFAAIVAAVTGIVLAGARKKIRGVLMLLIVLVICIPVAWAGLAMKNKAEKVPRIHDITTDTDNPPQFQTAQRLREGTATNPIEYGGPEIAAQQKLGYPDVQPLILNQPKSEVFALAVSVAKEMKWEITSEDPASGTFEAIATTAFFGFRDDVIVRLSEQNAQTKLDIRSVSRVGLSDVGANADRIQKYLHKVRKKAHLEH